MINAGDFLGMDVEMNAPSVLPRQTIPVRKQSSPVESSYNEQSNTNTNKGLC